MTYHVTCSTDDNYLQHCVAMLCSLFENNKEHEIYVHLLVDSLSDDSRQLISKLCKRYHGKAIYYNIDSKVLENVQLNSNINFNGKQMYSIATYFRMLLPTLLPKEIRRILYLDCDVIILQDISELYNLNLENYGVAAVTESVIYGSYHRFKMGLGLQHTTFCAGVMMINMDYWRQDHSQEKLLEYCKRSWKGVYMQDQDALNYVFRDRWFVLPFKWGKMPFAIAPIDKKQKWFDIKEFVEKPCIYHYSAHVKPWLDVWFPDKHYYWEYVKISGFPNPKKTHANRQLRIRIYKSVTRFIINKYIRPFIPDIVEILLKDIYNIILFTLNILRPKRFKDLMLKRWCQKYGMMK